MPTYRELLRHRKWQRKRLSIFNRDGWKCTRCSDLNDSIELHVHHLVYHRNRNPWEYEDCELTTLCDACHQIVHKRLGEDGFIPLREDAPGIVVACDVVDDVIVPGTVLMWMGTLSRENHSNKDPLWDCVHPKTGDLVFMDMSPHVMFRSEGFRGPSFHQWVRRCQMKALEEGL
jgi:hypothetical protein